MHGENFSVVGKTYPSHPLSTQPRRHINQKDLIQKRKEQNYEDLEKQKRAWD